MSFVRGPTKTAITRRIRPAGPGDLEEVNRLFPELGVDDPPLSGEKFVRELVPTTLVMEGPGRLDGYVFFQIMKGVAYVRHVVTEPAARRTGVARALLQAVSERAREAGCTSWCLNVKPANTAAIVLYEGMGMARVHTSQALKITWAQVEAAAALPDARFAVRLIEREEEAAVETATNMVEGQLATARAAGGRVLLALREGETIAGAAIFDPAFPGAYPFRPARAELALTLLRALRPHALPSPPFVKVVVEGQRDVTDALVAAGAVVDLDILHMKGPLPEA